LRKTGKKIKKGGKQSVAADDPWTLCAKKNNSEVSEEKNKGWGLCRQKSPVDEGQAGGAENVYERGTYDAKASQKMGRG